MELELGRELFRKRSAITLGMIPLPAYHDHLDPHTLRLMILAYARTGSFRAAADQIGYAEAEVRLALRRMAARDMIGLMVEEGTWPEGRQLGTSR